MHVIRILCFFLQRACAAIKFVKLVAAQGPCLKDVLGFQWLGGLVVLVQRLSVCSVASLLKQSNFGPKSGYRSCVQECMFCSRCILDLFGMIINAE